MEGARGLIAICPGTQQLLPDSGLYPASYGLLRVSRVQTISRPTSQPCLRKKSATVSRARSGRLFCWLRWAKDPQSGFHFDPGQDLRAVIIGEVSPTAADALFEKARVGPLASISRSWLASKTATSAIDKASITVPATVPTSVARASLRF